jgi:hypothetical protein
MPKRWWHEYVRDDQRDQQLFDELCDWLQEPTQQGERLVIDGDHATKFLGDNRVFVLRVGSGRIFVWPFGSSEEKEFNEPEPAKRYMTSLYVDVLLR